MSKMHVVNIAAFVAVLFTTVYVANSCF